MMDPRQGSFFELDYWVARACDEYDTLRSAGLFHVEAREATVQKIELLASDWAITREVTK